MEMNTMEDWELWARLAQEDPERFERERAAAIDKCINSQTSLKMRKRCRQLQWKIDAIRQISPTPLDSCLRIYDMLMDSFYGPKGLVVAMRQLGETNTRLQQAVPNKNLHLVRLHKSSSDHRNCAG